MIIDAFGKACPLPLMMTKKELDAGNRDLQIKVDNETAVKNLTRLGSKNSLAVTVDAIEGGYLVSLSEGERDASADRAAILKTTDAFSSGTIGSSYSVFVGKTQVGQGDETLGYNLMKMALYTLSESDQVPVSLLFMNSGVKLATDDEPQVIESIASLIDRGTEVLVCGTCLDYFGLTDKLKVGEVSNMYDILERMQEAAKVITL